MLGIVKDTNLLQRSGPQTLGFKLKVSTYATGFLAHRRLAPVKMKIELFQFPDFVFLLILLSL